MAEVLLSPGIQINETDQSFVPARPLVAGAAIIGPTVKGPADSPIVVTSYGDYQRTFGTTFMMNRYKEDYEDIVSTARQEKMNEKVPYSGSFIPVSGSSLENEELYVADGDNYTRYTGKVDPSVEYFVTASNFIPLSDEQEHNLYPITGSEVYYTKTTKEVIDEETCKAEEVGTFIKLTGVEAEEYKRQLDKLEEELVDDDEIWEKAMIQQKSQEFLTSIAAKSFFEQGGESLLVVRVTDNEFKSGRAEILTTGNPVPGTEGQERENQKVAFEIRTISQGENLNNWNKDDAFQDRTATTASIDGVIRDDGSLISGSKNNIRWEIADVDEETGTFSIYVRRGDDVDYDKTILEAFTGLNLDPDSANYISRRIGDQYQTLEEEITDDDVIYYVTVHGNYPNISKYIYVKDVNDIYGYFLADGYTRRGSKDDGTAEQVPDGKDEKGNCKYTYPEDVAYLLPQVCEGGFYDAKGKLFSSHEDEAKALFFEDITAEKADPALNPGVKIQGINPEEYNKLIAVLENQDEYEINMISVPGLTVAFNTTQTDMVNSLAQKRGDLIAVIDLVGFGSRIGDVQQKAMGLNSNYSAAYWPWLQMYSSTGRLEWVPASTIIPGVYTYTDHVAAPWFAPAGMTRGSVQGVVQTERKLLKQNRDDLYKKNVNPIAILPGNGITIYGQKTLQKKASALDRVNVRRLMIELKRTVRNMASGILFEMNDAQLRSTFKKNLDDYLESVVKRRGLYGYKTVVEEVNTPDVIDRNEFRCKIWIQPTKVIEFIYIDFTITNTGVDFS